MSSSFTITQAITFTITHAKHIAARVATDLKRVQRFYGVPSDSRISQYETELIELLKAGYLGTITYGFRRNDSWIEPTLRYRARELAGANTSDDDPGRVRPGANVSDASFYSYLTYSTAWTKLTAAEKEAFYRNLPFSRTDADEPGCTGTMVEDRTYSAGGRAVDRSSLNGW